MGKKKVKVLLLENVGTLGEAGQLITVSEGYARNFLFPQGKAALALESTVSQVKDKKARQKKSQQLALEKIQAKADSLDGTELVITTRVKEGNQIYGSVNAKNIAYTLNTEAKSDFKDKDILLDKPITSIGSHRVTVRFTAGVEAVIQLTVVPQEDDKTKKDAEE